MLPPLIDTHSHLDQLDGLDSAFLQASQAGVVAVVGVGTDLGSSQRLVDIAQGRWPLKVFVALGVHPTEIKEEELEETFAYIRQHHSILAAIGEIGLDYWHRSLKKKDKERKVALQREVYIRQLALAREFNRGVIIHSRGAWEDCVRLLKEQGLGRAVFHWYSGPLEVLEEILTAGFLISATPAVEYSPPHREAVKRAPLEQLLLETDSPVTYRPPEASYQSHPACLRRTLTGVAQLKGLSEEEVAASCGENARRFFGLSL